MSEYVEYRPAHESSLWRGDCARLRHLDIELTERCNNNCIHCWINRPADDQSAREKELSTQELKNILNEAANLGCLSVRFTGGEPLLRDDFEELYLCARRLGMKVMLATNGRLVSRSLCDLFCRIPPQSEIELSVYGMKAESYEGVTRVEGSYLQFRHGLDLLLARNIPFLVSGVLLPSNRSEVVEFESWAATIPWMTSPPLYTLFLDLRKRRNSTEKNREIEKLRLSPQDISWMLNRRPENERSAWMRFCRQTMHAGSDRLFRCGAVHGAAVDAYGECHACMSLCMPGWSYDLHGGNLAAALQWIRPRLRAARGVNPEYLRRCARCFLRPLCCQCPAKSWIETGTLDTPVEYLCAAAHVQACAAGLIEDGEKAWDVPEWENRVKLPCQQAGKGDC